jgi:hypothetical protein
MKMGIVMIGNGNGNGNGNSNGNNNGNNNGYGNGNRCHTKEVVYWNRTNWDYDTQPLTTNIRLE